MTISDFEFDPTFSPKLRVFSLGAGVQSSTLALMAEKGIVDRPDCAIFADTEEEPFAVYAWLKWLETQLSYPVYRVSKGSLWKSATRVRTSKKSGQKYIETAIPIYTQEGLKRGMGQRHCTRDFKILPIRQKVRELLGLKRVLKSHGRLVEMNIGISTDERLRMTPSEEGFIRHRWPLIEMDMSRNDCLRWMEAQGYPVPPRSACTFCPFHDDGEWLALTDAEFADSVKKESELQAAYAQTIFTGKPFLHEARVPLGEVKLVAKPKTEQLTFRLGKFAAECQGMCGV